MARERMFGYDLTCDSCSTYCDLDPLEVIEANEPIPDSVRDPNKIRALINFWLCGDCLPDYPKKFMEFFVADYFTEDELYLCDYCKTYIPEDVREEFDDTDVCLTCSPRTEEVEV
jgi:hypothetical protein